MMTQRYFIANLQMNFNQVHIKKKKKKTEYWINIQYFNFISQNGQPIKINGTLRKNILNGCDYANLYFVYDFKSIQSLNA